ncbi:IMPACT family protein [Propionicimonas sp.]|uniref:IMPACT family protein n=1 Tax=Propionicimonas sp. TaxID=1955623 RepID=UPI0039E2FFD6
MTTSLPSTIAGRVEHELVVKKSRFIATLEPVHTVAAADAAIAAVRRQHWAARHHCVALVVGRHAEQQRSSDDGEPSGTAGVPMLEVLRQRGLTDLVAVVTRYFGGVLLGAGGLVRAYSSAVSGALDGARIVRREVLVEVGIRVPHGDAGRFESWLRDWAAGHDAVLGEPVWTDVARFTILVPPAALTLLTADTAAFSAGTLAPVAGAERIVDLA